MCIVVVSAKSLGRWENALHLDATTVRIENNDAVTQNVTLVYAIPAASKKITLYFYGEEIGTLDIPIKKVDE